MTPFVCRLIGHRKAYLMRQWHSGAITSVICKRCGQTFHTDLEERII